MIRVEYFFIVLLAFYSWFGQTGLADREVQRPLQVLEQAGFDSLHNGSYTVPALGLFTAGGFDLLSDSGIQSFTARLWDVFTVRDEVKVLSVQRTVKMLLLPFDGPDIVYPFHFFR